MNEGPFRVSRPVDRRPVNRTAPARPQSESPQAAQAVPEPPLPAAPERETRKTRPTRSKRFRMPIIVVLVVLAIAAAGYYFISSHGSTAIDSSKYQAVFFTNGQVYFGKLHQFNGESMKLTDIFYLQSSSSNAGSSNPQSTSSDKSNVQLIKLGDEIHGPEDEMIISKDQVLFYENLKPDGKVAQSIAKYK